MNHWRSAWLAAAGWLLLADATHATVTLEINVSGFANSSGTATNGMSWGIVVATSGNSFNFLSSLDPLASVTTNGFLEAGGTTTTDYYLWNNGDAANQTTFTGPPPTFSPGTIGDTGPLTLGVNGLASGEQFGLIWWQTGVSGGDSFGFYTNSSMVLPADPGTYNVSSEVTPTGTQLNAQYLIVPEPSTAALLAGGLVFLTLLQRRRRRTAFPRR